MKMSGMNQITPDSSLNSSYQDIYNQQLMGKINNITLPSPQPIDSNDLGNGQQIDSQNYLAFQQMDFNNPMMIMSTCMPPPMLNLSPQGVAG